MSEQQREPSEAPGAAERGSPQSRFLPETHIEAEEIKATNVVSGIQNNIYNYQQVQKYVPPLQLPRRAEHFADRVNERAWLLAHLRPGQIVTLCGPGGMGKTALVAELLWALAPNGTPNPAFPHGIVFHSFYGRPEVTVALEQLARTFGEDPLPTPAHAAQRALSGKHALLVLDGTEEAENLEQVLAVCASCTVLMTTRRRSDAPDPASRLDLQPLPEQEAVSVVQAFGGKQAVDATATADICACVGNLPLALRLIGRYLAEQKEEASEYLSWLQHSPLAALDQGRSRQESVPLLMARSVARLSATAQEALRLVGLLALAPFERNLVAETLKLAEEVARRALGELATYGLLLRQQSHYEVSHPLIHTYAREALFSQADPAVQKAVFDRVVHVLQEQFPEVEYTTWKRCRELLPHVKACAAFVAQLGEAELDVARLLTRAGWYLRETGRYAQAELLLQPGFRLYDQIGDAMAPGLLSMLNNLGLLYKAQGRYEDAEPLYQRSLAICEQTLEPDHPDTASTVDNLAQLYKVQGRYAEAELLYQRALAIKEQALGADHPSTASTVDNLANLYKAQGRYEEAEPLYQRALAIKEQALGADHPSTASTVDNLANLYRAQGRYEEAEPLYQRALAIKEQVLPPDHPDTATTLNNLANLYQEQRRFEEAEPLYLRDLAISEKALPPDHPDTATTLNNLAELYRAQGRYEEAEPFYQRALAIEERVLPPDHPDTATTLVGLALLYQEQERYKEAEPLYLHALAVYEKALGPDHPDTAATLNNLAELYEEQERYKEAEPLYLRSLTISEKALGLDHPDTATTLVGLAFLYQEQERYEEAEPLYLHALGVYEKALGLDHPYTATTLENYASLLHAMHQASEAIPLEQRARAIRAKQQPS